MPHVLLNGRSVGFLEGQTILSAVRSAGIELPTLCHDDRLKPFGGCRLCLVHIEGRERPEPACQMHLADGMVIETHTPELEDYRRTVLGFLAASYPEDAIQAHPDKEFHRALKAYAPEALQKIKPEPTEDLSHPYIAVDMSRCIDCLRCVRICEEVQGQFVWGVWGRGESMRIVPDSATTLAESSCVSCGACVDTCPSGALEDKTVLERGRPEQWTRTTCPYCGVGCDMDVGTRSDRIVQIRPAPDSPVNKGHLCVKGRYAFDFVDAPDRILSPMLKENGHWKTVSWADALAFAAGKLREILKTHGPEAVGVLGSARATNEENYLTQKFARAVLGTNNVDCCARVCHTPSAAALKWMLGTGAATNSFDDIERARTLLLCGTNATENHPVIGARIKECALRGARLIVVDPRRTELARHAAIHLPLRPGTNVPLLNAMAHVIVTEGLQDEAFLNQRVSERREFEDFLRSWPPARAAAITGVPEENIRRAARLYAMEKPAMSLHGLGMTEHLQGTEAVMCLVNLALLTGNLGKRGTGVNPLRGQNNVQGAAHMGCDPSILTGSVSLKEARARFEKIWGVPIPERRGLNLLEMMDASLEGRFKALWIIGYDVFLSNANASKTRRSFEALDLVVVQDLFLNETAREFGHVFFPAVSGFEKDGTYMNSERRIQRVRRVLEPRGDGRTDAEILWAAAHALGRADLLTYPSAEAVWEEIRLVWPGAAGITYGRLESSGLQWPCPNEDHPGTEVLYQDGFHQGDKASFRRIDYQPTPETVDEDYPFLLTTGRNLYQFNAGTMTARTPNNVLRPDDFLDVAPEDAGRLGLEPGDRVRLISRHGETNLPVRIDPAIRPGTCFATFHTSATFLNRITGNVRDSHVKSPEYKVTAVRIEKS